MNYKIMMSIGISKLCALFGRRKPVVACWKITETCNGQCLYCSYGQPSRTELDFFEVSKILDQMHAVGVRAVSFTGGEPLVREDMVDILNYAKTKGFFVKLNTNGVLLKDRIEKIRKLDAIQLSLDGKEEIHEKTRPKGTFLKVLESIRVAKDRRIPIFLNTVISKVNAPHLESVLDVCRQEGVAAFFQPARINLLGAGDTNSFCMRPQEYKNSIMQLMSLKEGARYKKLILNSLSGLEYLYSWPNPKNISCYAGSITFRIDAQGVLYNCDEFREEFGVNILQYGFGDAVKRLRRFTCKECWCGSQAEANLLFDLDIGAVLNFLQTNTSSD